MAYILGAGAQGEFIVRLSKQEIAQLQGFSSPYCTGFKESSIAVGQSFDLSAIYTEAVLALETHKTAINAAHNLKKASSQFLKFFKEEENKK